MTTTRRLFTFLAMGMALATPVAHAQSVDAAAANNAWLMNTINYTIMTADYAQGEDSRIAAIKAVCDPQAVDAAIKAQDEQDKKDLDALDAVAIMVLGGVFMVGVITRACIGLSRLMKQ